MQKKLNFLLLCLFSTSFSSSLLISASAGFSEATKEIGRYIAALDSETIDSNATLIKIYEKISLLKAPSKFELDYLLAKMPKNLSEIKLVSPDTMSQINTLYFLYKTWDLLQKLVQMSGGESNVNPAEITSALFSVILPQLITFAQSSGTRSDSFIKEISMQLDRLRGNEEVSEQVSRAMNQSFKK